MLSLLIHLKTKITESLTKLSRKRKWTQLHDACEEGNLTKVRGLLLINNANIDARSNFGSNPLYIANLPVGQVKTFAQ